MPQGTADSGSREKPRPAGHHNILLGQGDLELDHGAVKLAHDLVVGHRVVVLALGDVGERARRAPAPLPPQASLGAGPRME